jgi:hypothetical protein
MQGLDKHGRALFFRTGEILDSIIIDYTDVDMVGYIDYYTSDQQYLLDRETVRHALYETIPRSFFACHFTFVGWAESNKTMDLYNNLKYLWPIVGKSEVLFNQHFRTSTTDDSSRLRRFGSTTSRSMTMASVN